jgi:hypothetical protein
MTFSWHLLHVALQRTHPQSRHVAVRRYFKPRISPVRRANNAGSSVILPFPRQDNGTLAFRQCRDPFEGSLPDPIAALIASTGPRDHAAPKAIACQLAQPAFFVCRQMSAVAMRKTGNAIVAKSPRLAELCTIHSQNAVATLPTP